MTSSRRAFLATGSTLLAASVLKAAEAPVRAAVIGHTGRGDYGHGLDAIFRGRAGIELVAVADPDSAGRDRAVRATGAARGYADWREMLAKERPALVSIAMRHADQHAEIALGCIAAGIHLYMEKPFVRSPDEADKVLAAARARGVCIAVAHTMRITPVVRRFKQALDDGLIGELREMRAYGKQDNRAGGEDMMVLGSHLFDLMHQFAGVPEWCTARVLQSGREITAADRRLVKDNVGWVAGDQVFAQFGFANGVHATFTSDGCLRETVGHWGIEFHGTKGVARVNCDIAPNVFVRSNPAWTAVGRTDVWKPFEPELAPLASEHSPGPVDDWLAAIREKRQPECSGVNGALAVEMVAGVYRAALGRTRVAFPLTDRAHPLGEA